MTKNSSVKKKVTPNLKVSASFSAMGDAGKPMSNALSQAMCHVKEFMTDSQKSFILLREGKLLMENFDFRGAIDCFNEGISYNPTAVNLFNMKAACHKALDMHSEAYFDYSYTIRLEPDVGSHYCARGLCLARLKKASMAIEDLDVAIQLDTCAAHFYARATTFAEFGKFELAIDDFSSAIGDESPVPPSSAGPGIAGVSSSGAVNEMRLKAKFKRSLAYFELKMYDEVVRDCTAVLHLDANNVATRALLGRALKVLNEHKKAEEQLTFALLLDESQAALYTERGDIRFRTGQKNKVIEAIYDFDRAVKLLENKLATRYLGPESLSSARIVSKLGRSPSFSLGAVSMPPAAAGKSIAVSIAAAAEGSLPALLNAAGAVSSSLGLALRKIEEGDDGSNEDHRDDGDEATHEAVNNEPPHKVLRPPTLARLGTKPQLAIASSPVSLRQPGALARSGSVSSNISKDLVFGAGPGAGYSAAYYREVEEQLADTLYKRAQAKLMVETSAANVEAALSDAIKSSAYQPEDDDYQMVIATCYIRLHRHADALRVLSHILDRSPDNHKALYNFAFCERASGRPKDAIEGLTKIIAYSQQQQHAASFGDTEQFQPAGVGADGAASHLLSAVPIHRVYEMRGTLFHEMQAHKLALHDLGRAIAINPSHADNYYLRGDCQSKLGNYEQALSDFNLAEQRQFEDRCSLLIARGGCRRLLGDSVGAAVDFNNAYQMLDRSDKVGKVRILSFKAFCQIDQQLYSTAYDSLIVAQQFNSELVAEKISAHGLDYEAVNRVIQRHITDKSEAWLDMKRKNKLTLSPTEGDILYLKRVDWILLYHLALCLYMQHNFAEAERVFLLCVSDEALKFVPDDLSRGTQLFFLALTEMHLEKLSAAAQHLDHCAETHWTDAKHNKFLHLYAMGKLLQRQGLHLAAVDKFSQAVSLCPDNAHCYFKRAWSYKALNDFVCAGEDFEHAKALRPLDPNFAVDYRRISGLQYMVIGTEPDLVEPLMPLLPVPGLACK